MLTVSEQVAVVTQKETVQHPFPFKLGVQNKEVERLQI